MVLFCISSCSGLSVTDSNTTESFFNVNKSNHSTISTDTSSSNQICISSNSGLSVADSNTTESFFNVDQSENIIHESESYPNYYKEHLRSKLYTLNKIREQNSISYTFSFLTDLHWISNAKKSPQLVKYLSDSFEINKIVLGGDYINYDYEEIETPKSIMKDCVNSFSFGNYTAIVGNHDSNWNQGKDTPRIQDREIFNIINNTDSLYPYTSELDYDKKLCSLYLNSGIGSFTDPDQKAFIYNTLKNLDNSWYVILFVHIIFDGSYHKDNLSVIRPAGEQFLEYFSSIKESLSCNFVGVFSGHSHLDYLNTKDYCFPVVTTMCDSLGTFTPDYNIYLREKDTYTEQAFDVIQVDTKNRKVFLTRIGAGVDRFFEF